tara:strand:+ start:3353 stop:3742 length:390 start_codon:yes stop_codon:yes gene_type:complete
MAKRIIQNEIEKTLLKDIEVPFQSLIELYIVTEEDLYESENGDNVYKNMIGCFRTYDKAKWFLDFKNENNTDNEYQYEVKTIKLTKDADDYLFLPERIAITPSYKDTLTIPHILKYLAKLQNIERLIEI